MAHFIGHHGGIGVDGADNLQGLVVFERLAEAGAGAEFVGHGVGLFSFGFLLSDYDFG